jgi:hypothetical protein
MSECALLAIADIRSVGLPATSKWPLCARARVSRAGSGEARNGHGSKVAGR